MQPMTRQRAQIYKRYGFLFAMVVCLWLFFTPPALAGEVTIIINTPEELPAMGETFTVKLDISENPGICSAQFILTFDSSVIECTTVEVGEVLKSMMIMTNAKIKKPVVGAMVSAATSDIASGDGELATFTFQVLSISPPNFEIADSSFRTASGEMVAISTIGGEMMISNTTTNQPIPVDFNAVSEVDTCSPTIPTTPITPTTSENTMHIFQDVSASHWAVAYIERASQIGLISAYPDGSFQPETKITRAQFVNMLWRLAGSPNFIASTRFLDVNVYDWYGVPISWAADFGYVKGVNDSFFSPNDYVTREQAMVILYRFSGNNGCNTTMSSTNLDNLYQDATLISGYSKDAVCWAIDNGVINGMNTSTIAPQETATRAQIVATFLRYKDKFQQG